MKTDELIRFLAQGAGPAPQGLARRRIGPALVAGLLASMAGAYLTLGFVPAQMYSHPAPWFKLAYALSMLLAAVWLVSRLARPAAPARTPAMVTVSVLLAAAAVGVGAWMATPAEVRTTGLLGHSWAWCPWFVLLLSVPALAGQMWALRGLAPTRPVAAGLAAGLVAGALGAGGYAFACTELAMSFVAAWYTAGILLAGGLGAVLGPRLLRW